MADPFLAETVMFGGNFNPRSWANCDGQLLPISGYSALFSILGTTYGGDGRTTFALPDCRGRAAIHPGHGPGLSTYNQGPGGGHENVTLTINNMPNHNHLVNAVAAPGTQQVPNNAYLAGDDSNQDKIYAPATTTPNTQMTSNTIAHTGGGQSFNVVNPWVGIRFIIALQGLYPSRN